MAEVWEATPQSGVLGVFLTDGDVTVSTRTLGDRKNLAPRLERSTVGAVLID